MKVFAFFASAAAMFLLGCCSLFAMNQQVSTSQAMLRCAVILRSSGEQSTLNILKSRIEVYLSPKPAELSEHATSPRFKRSNMREELYGDISVEPYFGATVQAHPYDPHLHVQSLLDPQVRHSFPIDWTKVSSSEGQRFKFEIPADRSFRLFARIDDFADSINKKHINLHMLMPDETAPYSMFEPRARFLAREDPLQFFRLPDNEFYVRPPESLPLGNSERLEDYTSGVFLTGADSLQQLIRDLTRDGDAVKAWWGVIEADNGDRTSSVRDTLWIEVSTPSNRTFQFVIRAEPASLLINR